MISIKIITQALQWAAAVLMILSVWLLIWKKLLWWGLVVFLAAMGLTLWLSWRAEHAAELVQQLVLTRLCLWGLLKGRGRPRAKKGSAT